jgi:hypothetical protein
MNIKKDIGVNDPCYCKSGKKYKKCCLRKDEEKQQELRNKLNALTTENIKNYMAELYDSIFYGTPIAPMDKEESDFLTWFQKDINEGENNLKEYENKLALTNKS